MYNLTILNFGKKIFIILFFYLIVGKCIKKLEITNKVMFKTYFNYHYSNNIFFNPIIKK